MSRPAARYLSAEEDSARWIGFPFRDGDIVISTRSKTGTTWLQMICALLVFQSTELPDRLSRLSPWLDHLGTPRDALFAQLSAQDHRRVIKTHTPLDGLPVDEGASYIVTGRHPLDMAVSLYHQSQNIDRARLAELTGQPSGKPPSKPLRDWLLSWIESHADPREAMDSLPGVMWHLSDAWSRRREPNVMLVHYDDLQADLEGQMRRLAGWLSITVPEETWPALVEAAGFEQMRANPDLTVPDGGIFKDPAAFFRRGQSGAAREILSDGEMARYTERAAELSKSKKLLGWLHGPRP